MWKNCLLTIFLASLLTASHGQWGEEPVADKPSFNDRIFTGGGFGLSFLNYSDYFSISPIIAIRLLRSLQRVLVFNTNTPSTNNTLLPLQQITTEAQSLHVTISMAHCFSTRSMNILAMNILDMRENV